MSRLHAVMWTVLLALASCDSPIDPAAPPFRALDYEAALAEASRDGKLVFIDFYAAWCPPCRRLDAVTWKAPEVVSWLETNTVPIKVDAERNAQLAEQFLVDAYPTLVFMDPARGEVLRLIGFHDARGFLEIASRQRLEREQQAEPDSRD